MPVARSQTPLSARARGKMSIVIRLFPKRCARLETIVNATQPDGYRKPIQFWLDVSGQGIAG